MPVVLGFVCRRHDTWQLVTAGVCGGRHGMPESIAAHPAVFVTLTAPSFGTAIAESHGGLNTTATPQTPPTPPNVHRRGHFMPHILTVNAAIMLILNAGQQAMRAGASPRWEEGSGPLSGKRTPASPGADGCDGRPRSRAPTPLGRRWPSFTHANDPECAGSCRYLATPNYVVHQAQTGNNYNHRQPRVDNRCTWPFAASAGVGSFEVYLLLAASISLVALAGAGRVGKCCGINCGISWTASLDTQQRHPGLLTSH